MDLCRLIALRRALPFHCPREVGWTGRLVSPSDRESAARHNPLKTLHARFHTTMAVHSVNHRGPAHSCRTAGGTLKLTQERDRLCFGRTHPAASGILTRTRRVVTLGLVA